MDLNDAVTDEDHHMGVVSAPIAIVEYGDFECPNCKQAASAVEMLLKRFAGQVCFVYRHFPLEEVHPRALQAAEAAEAAAIQGRFWEMHRLLYDNQGALDSEDLDGYASLIGLDVARYRGDMRGHVHLPRIRTQMDSARRSGVRSTPGFFVQGARQDVSFGLHKLFDATAAALGRLER